jgi:hydroxymethylglutaryl-CoA lyase
MNLPKEIIICDVCPRDGFQMESNWIPTEKKVEVIEAIATSGVPIVTGIDLDKII